MTFYQKKNETLCVHHSFLSLFRLDLVVPWSLRDGFNNPGRNIGAFKKKLMQSIYHHLIRFCFCSCFVCLFVFSFFPL